MIVNAKVARFAEKLLFDDGAKVKFISHSFCQQNNTVFQSSKYSAEVANGMKQAFFELTNPVEGLINSYTEKFHFAVSHLERYSVLLGKQWLLIKQSFSARQIKFISQKKTTRL